MEKRRQGGTCRPAAPSPDADNEVNHSHRRHRGGIAHRRRRAAERGAQSSPGGQPEPDRHRRPDDVRDRMRLLPPERRPGGRQGTEARRHDAQRRFHCGAGQEGEGRRHARLWQRVFGESDHGDRGLHPDPRAVRPAMRYLVLASLLVFLGAVNATARTLEAIRQRGALTLCAHPNALPYASKRDAVPGFQVEIAGALAKQLGVSLEQHWVINSFQYRRADCDIILDAIADRAALAEVGLRMSQPYHRSGVALAVGPKSGVASLTEFGPDLRVGVQVGSIASMTLGKRGVKTSPFAFEDDIMDALAKGEIDAAAVTPAAIGWFNKTHPDGRVRR